MRLGHDPDTALGGIGQNSRHGDLGSRMEMDLGLLDVNKLSWFSDLKRNQDGQRLRDAESRVRYADEIMGATLLRVQHASDPEFDLCVINAFGLDLPG